MFLDYGSEEQAINILEFSLCELLNSSLRQPGNFGSLPYSRFFGLPITPKSWAAVSRFRSKRRRRDGLRRSVPDVRLLGGIPLTPSSAHITF